MKKNIDYHLILLMLIPIFYMSGIAQVSPNIRLNQVGFYPNCSKVAIITGNPPAGSFFIRSTNQVTTYFTGTLGASATWTYSGETVRAADFSAFTLPGTYVLTVPGVGYSYTFEIANAIFAPMAKAGLKTFYFQRGSTALLPAHAGIYARAAGHMDNAVIIHPSAASPARPAGTVLSSPKGWYDAGDYNSYIVNSGITTYTLLAAYEHFKPYYDTLDLNIPESGGAMPDILDEIKWNLDWMLTMQDPNDGGVYNKKTCANFSGYVMPAGDVAPRYFCAKGTAATFDFAAVMATAYRIYRPYNLAFANQCLAAAQFAWTWGLANPNVVFTNPGANGAYPAVNTGEYGDWALNDDREWAANELYIATGNANYYYNYGFNNANYYGVPSWPDVRTLGLMSLVFHRKNLTAAALPDTTNMKNRLIGIAAPLQAHQSTASAYRVAMGQAAGDFNWGSNSITANQGMILLAAYELNQNVAYCNAALANLDYILGRNATNYSFVTGFGDRTPMDIHHRISYADGIVNPVPGFMVGGPQNLINPDGCAYALNTPAGRYIDNMCSYSTNEIAINWNAPFVYLSAGLGFLMPCHQLTLPLEFIQFSAKPQDDEILLHWTTANERNTGEFSVQRSKDGIHFETIGTLPAKGFTTELTHYSFVDQFPPNGSSFYRILERDTDGALYNSEVISINRSYDALQLYPNPNTGVFTLDYGIEGLQGDIGIYNAVGELVFQSTLSSMDSKKAIDLSFAAKGMYSVLLRTQQGSVKKILVLQ
jgi:endoglucanase